AAGDFRGLLRAVCQRNQRFNTVALIDKPAPLTTVRLASNVFACQCRQDEIGNHVTTPARMFPAVCIPKSGDFATELETPIRGYCFGHSIRVRQPRKLRADKQKWRAGAKECIEDTSAQLRVMFELFMLAVGGFDVFHPSGIPRQKPNSITVTKRLVVNVAKIAAALQIERDCFMASAVEFPD